jgi:hypothetical protein
MTDDRRCDDCWMAMIDMMIDTMTSAMTSAMIAGRFDQRDD